jgi:predicted ferric reductase
MSGILLSFGQAAALTGIMLLSLNFVLAARYYWVERLFYGLNKVYIHHHYLGAIAFSLLLLHPVGVLMGYALVSISLATAILTPSWQNLPVFSGSLALLIMTVLLFITLFMKIPYNTWKKTHQYLGLVLFFAGIHGLLIGSTLDLSTPLKIYILGWIAIGLTSALVRIFNVRLGFHNYDYAVSEVIVVKDLIVIKLSPAGKKRLKFVPGQFVFVSFKSLGITGESHPFSLAGKVDDETLSIAAKSLGDYTETLKLLKNGAAVKIEGPYGRFSHRYAKFLKQIWIAGGIGVTPFMSMAYDVSGKNEFDIDMYYTVGKSDEGLFNDELTRISQNGTGFRYSLWITDEKGRITAENIKLKGGDPGKCEIFICGPKPMMKALAEQYNRLGVKNSRIHTEEFGLY